MRCRGVLALGLAVLGASSSLTACGGEKSPHEQQLIDAQAGTYRGVGLHDDLQTLQSKLHFLARSPSDPAFLRNFLTGIHPAPRFRPQGTGWMANRDVYFGLKGGLASGLIVRGDGAATQRGVAIGDPLDDAKHTYSDLTCGTAETSDEGEQFPACAGRVGPRVFIWFGGDPIDAIQLSPLPYPNPPTSD